MNAFGPLGDLGGMAGGAERGALVLGLVPGDFSHRVAAIVPVPVVGLVDEKIPRCERRRAKQRHEKYEAYDVFRHVPTFLQSRSAAESPATI